jgi:hypothetical protein
MTCTGFARQCVQTLEVWICLITMTTPSNGHGANKSVSFFSGFTFVQEGQLVVLTLCGAINQSCGISGMYGMSTVEQVGLGS